jgi:hypothetical protein
MMMSTYVGLYVQRLENGSMHNVQVQDFAGNEIPLSPEEYDHRGIHPDIGELPDEADYKAKKND